MRHSFRLSIALAATAAGALAGSPVAAAAVPRLPPGLPRPPKVTTYDALLDVGGYVEVKVERDDTAECLPGQDITIDFESSFELGGPRRTAVTIINGGVVSGIVSNRGGVSHKGALSGYRETNYCPPTRRAELEKPACTSARGKLTAILGTRADGFVPRPDDELAPLVHPVTISLTRFGGATQDESCRRYLSSGLRSAIRDDSALSVFDTTAAGLVIPIGAHDGDFTRLTKGRWVRRVMALNGACDHVLIRRAPTADGAARDRSKCTVNGRIYIAIKRVS